MFLSFDNLSAEVVHGVLDVWTENNTGEPTFRQKRNMGRIVKLASRRALPSPSPSANLVGIREGQLRRDWTSNGQENSRLPLRHVRKSGTRELDLRAIASKSTTFLIP